MHTNSYSINSPPGEKDPLLVNKQASDEPPTYETTKPDDFEPTDKHKQTGSSTYGAIFNFAKASVGSGSFTLPWGMMQAGVILGSVAMLIIGSLSLYTMLLIVEIRRACQRISNNKNIDFSSMGTICMGIPGRVVVDISVVMCNLGVCAGYVIFIGGNLRVPLHCWIGYPTSMWFTYAIIIPILILLTLIPSFKFLAYASLVGWVFLAIAMSTVYYYGTTTRFKFDIIYFNPEGFPLFYGVTAFLFCIHSMVVPVEMEMAKPTQMNVVLLVAGTVVIVVNLPFAIYGYLLFGSDTKGVIFDNLPSGTFNNIVRLMLSAELTLTFPLVFKPASQIFENYLNQLIPRLTYLKIVILRPLLVLVSFGLAISVPYFEFMAALVGGFATTLLAFIWPPLFHFLLLRKTTNIFRNLFHILLLLVGILSIATTTFTTILHIIDTETNAANKTSNSSVVCETISYNLSNVTQSSDTFLLSGIFH